MIESPGVLLLYTLLLSSPVLIIWGWIRWKKHSDAKSVFSILSLLGFSLATASASLVIASSLYARVTGGYAFYAPSLLLVYDSGVVLSIEAVAFALGGVWRTNSLRWHALICGAGTLLFWAIRNSRRVTKTKQGPESQVPAGNVLVTVSRPLLRVASDPYRNWNRRSARHRDLPWLRAYESSGWRLRLPA